MHTPDWDDWAETCRNICIWSNYRILLARSLIFSTFEQITKYGELIGLPMHLNIQLSWAHWTPFRVQYLVSSMDTFWSTIFILPWAQWTHSRVQYSTLVSSSDNLQSTIFNYSKLIQHPPEFNIQVWWVQWTPSGVQYSDTVSSPNTLWTSIFNSSWAQWTHSGVQYSTLVCSMDTLQSHTPEFNIQLWLAHQTPSRV